jgi:hypothetical protein
MTGKPQVVITRKDKRLHKWLHLGAFTATGGASARSQQPEQPLTRPTTSVHASSPQTPTTPHSREASSAVKHGYNAVQTPPSPHAAN